jgi:hypothetical protein
MKASAEQGEQHPEATQDTQADAERPVEAARASMQAARVRESLVRCPGIDGQRAA